MKSTFIGSEEWLDPPDDSSTAVESCDRHPTFPVVSNSEGEWHLEGIYYMLLCAKTQSFKQCGESD